MPLKIVRNDIVKMNTEAIVNTANANVAVGRGCDYAIYAAAGRDELLKYREEKIGPAQEGDVFITPGFALQAKYIIHAVSPMYLNGRRGEEEKLRSCYRNSLLLAQANGIRSIAFPLIASGSYCYPKEEGMRIALDEINAFLLENEMDVCLVVYDDEATALGKKLYPDLESYIDRHYIPLTAPGGFVPKDADFDMQESYAPMNADICMSECYASEDADICMSECYAPEDEDFDATDFFGQHESRLAERMLHLTDTFSEYLMYLIKNKNMENADVWKRAIVDKKVFSKIKNHPDYHPQKLTALCLCVGAKLNLDETKDLLARAGYALSPCDKTDIIFSYFIENEIYDMIELDIQLEEHGLPCIIA